MSAQKDEIERQNQTTELPLKEKWNIKVCCFKDIYVRARWLDGIQIIMPGIVQLHISHSRL